MAPLSISLSADVPSFPGGRGGASVILTACRCTLRVGGDGEDSTLFLATIRCTFPADVVLLRNTGDKLTSLME